MSDCDWTVIQKAVGAEWDASIIPALSAYIEVPNQSPDFDPHWATNGLMEKAFHILIDWVKGQNLLGFSYEFMEVEGRTPFLLVEIAGTERTNNTVLMYGHMDKQPPLRPWAEGLDPHKAVMRDGKLYGRGAADDGYAIFSAITSVSVLQRHGIPHGRVVVVIEACEESGSFDLDYYMAQCKERIGNVDLIVCLDSGSLNYDQLWLTTSLRGVTGGVLNVQTLTEAMHSGVAGGVVPDTFRIARELLDRVEDSKTGTVLLPEAHCEIPDHVAKSMVSMKSVPFKQQFAMADGVSAEPGDNVELALRNFWKPSLTVTGANLPEPQIAGNVIRTLTSLKLSLRLPPLVDSGKATQAMAKLLTTNPPYGAKVWFEPEVPGDGCATPELKPWLSNALNEGSKMAYGNPLAYQGVGCAIPFISTLTKMYPQAQFIVTGVLGPKSNAHGPNEFLHVGYAKGLTLAISHVVAAHFLLAPR